MQVCEGGLLASLLGKPKAELKLFHLVYFFDGSLDLVMRSEVALCTGKSLFTVICSRIQGELGEQSPSS